MPSLPVANDLAVSALVITQMAVCVGVLIYVAVNAGIDAMHLFVLRQKEQELAQVVAQAVADAAPQSVREGAPMFKVDRANAQPLLAEQFNTMLGEQGVAVQTVALDRVRDFGGGMTAYSVRVAGRADAAALESALRLLSANTKSVAVQRVVAQPLSDGARPELADVGLNFIVLASER
jgi:hypothetical protein